MLLWPHHFFFGFRSVHSFLFVFLHVCSSGSQSSYILESQWIKSISEVSAVKRLLVSNLNSHAIHEHALSFSHYVNASLGLDPAVYLSVEWTLSYFRL